ncbi:MAG: hypothetical protein KDK71_04625, partial [Chlamydiia bacterium]|nr:hypothetical protein [Chlamydiia bacterium]
MGFSGILPGEINQLSKRKMATANSTSVQSLAGMRLFEEASKNPEKLKGKPCVGQAKEKEVVVIFDVRQLNDLGEAMATIGDLELEKVKNVFHNFPFEKLTNNEDLKKRILEKYPEANKTPTPPAQKRQLLTRKGSTGAAAQRYLKNAGGNGTLNAPILKAAFEEWVKTPKDRQADDSAFIYSIAEWAMKETSDEVLRNCPRFFANLPADKTQGLTQVQKIEITTFRLEKELGDVGALDSMEKAKEIAEAHFSDAVGTAEFAGKQRVLHSLVAQKDEGLLGVIGTLMKELRELQRTYYTECYYIGKRVNAKIEAATEKDVSFFKNDLLGLQVRRLLKQPIVGVEWNEAACEALTPEELRVILENKPIEEFNAYMLNGENDASVESTEKEPGAILQAKLEGDFKKRIVAQVIAKKHTKLRGLIEWEGIDLETRQKAKNALFTNETNPENYRPLAQGLDTEGVQKVFGTGKLSAYVHTELKLPQEKVKWEGDAYEALEGEAYVQFLLQQSQEWDKLEANVRGTLAKKRPELQARIFVAYKGKISENIDWSKNEALTLAMKKQCAESYANYGLFPQQLKQVFTTAEIAEEFEFVIQKTWGNAEQLQKMDWAKASKEQRQKGLARVKQLIPNHTVIQYEAFAKGLNSQQIRECFGTGIDAARMYLAMNFSLDGIEWDDTVVGILEGEVLLKWLNTHVNLSNELERFLSVTDNHALIPKLNDPLKKAAVAYFYDNSKPN